MRLQEHTHDLIPPPQQSDNNNLMGGANTLYLSRAEVFAWWIKPHEHSAVQHPGYYINHVFISQQLCTVWDIITSFQSIDRLAASKYVLSVK